MPTAAAVAGVLSTELSAGAGVEHMRGTVKLTLEGLPIDQAYGARAGNRPEAGLRGFGALRHSGRCGKCRPAAIQNDGLDAEYWSMNQTRAALVIWPPS